MNAEEYAEHWDRNKIWLHYRMPRHQKRFRTIASALRGGEGRTFADIGCVFGHSTHKLKALVGGEWMGIDFSELAIARAREAFPAIDFRFIENIDGLRHLPQFDGVVCSEVIEHLEDDALLVEGLVAMTRRVLVVTTPCVAVKSVNHLRLYDEKSLAELFGEYSGIRIAKAPPFFYAVMRKPNA